MLGEPRAVPPSGAGVPDQPADSTGPPQGRSRTTLLLRSWARDLAVSIGIATFIILFIYQPVKVEGTSMLPGLEDQERIFVNKFVYRLGPIQRGDVIVFRYPRDPAKSYIKRVVAVGGDRVRIERGTVYVNGAALQEDYIPDQFRDFRSSPEMAVPPGSYFVLGDHRSLSNDSRDFGPVPQDLVTGKAVFAYWPVAKLGALR